jgi:hypothetical protein
VPWTVSPLITILGSGIYDLQSNNGLFPRITDKGHANRYEAGTFQVIPVPEPATYAILGSFMAFALFTRSRKAAKRVV